MKKPGSLSDPSRDPQLNLRTAKALPRRSLIGTAPGTGISGPETKIRDCRISANGDRGQFERKRKSPPVAGLSRLSLQNAKTADWVVGTTGIEPVTHVFAGRIEEIDD
jgi:hypothetical protein